MTVDGTVWFLISIVFLVLYAIFSGIVERSLRRAPSSRKYVRQCWYLIAAGATFVLAEVLCFYPIVQAHKDNWGIALFVWLCVNGIMAFMIGGKVVELMKLIRDSRK